MKNGDGSIWLSFLNHDYQTIGYNREQYQGCPNISNVSKLPFIFETSNFLRYLYRIKRKIYDRVLIQLTGRKTGMEAYVFLYFFTISRLPAIIVSNIKDAPTLLLFQDCLLRLKIEFTDCLNMISRFSAIIVSNIKTATTLLMSQNCILPLKLPIYWYIYIG